MSSGSGSGPAAPSRSRTFDATHAAVAFPLGGVGTGNVSLGARGDLRDWEIFNRPAKGNPMPNTFFALRAAWPSRTIARVLEGPIQPPHDRSHGYHPWTAAGLPRFRSASFRGEYPIATLELYEPEIPLGVQLEAFTPLVPLDPEASGLPCAVLTWSITNTADEPVALAVVGSLINPVGGLAYDPFGNIAAGGTGGNRNELRREASLAGLFLHSEQYAASDLLHGDLTLVTTHPEITVKPAWLRGAWYDFLREFWDDLVDDGRLDDLGYDEPSPPGRTDTGSLGAVDTLAPGATGTYRFILAWSFPNRVNGWDQDADAPIVRNHYATHFADSWAVARHVVGNLPHLEGETRRFRAGLFESSLPPAVIDAVSANVVPVRSPTCFWLEDGRFYGYEGCFDTAGSCEGTCTHVWSYAQTVAHLFPSLERDMRRTELTVETDPNGWMAFRSHRTFGGRFEWPWGDQAPEAAVDGQMGTIVRAYREWRLSGDRPWLEAIWPGIERAIGFAGSHWDRDGDGVLDGRQHNTYDIEFFGPNPLSQIYYLAALRAVEELAIVLGDTDATTWARGAFARSAPRTDELLWNGEYFAQVVDDIDAHPYQHGQGCLSDQLLGQLHARLLDLGDLLPADHVRSALRAIATHNTSPAGSQRVNCQRSYVAEDEQGLLLCTWPRGGRPRFPFVYSDEVWTGVEYQVAAHLVLEGFRDEGLAIVEATRARHDGLRRNPWNEVECGHHYVRSMASWALLLAWSGATCDVATGLLGFAPADHVGEVSVPFFAGTGWGAFSFEPSGERPRVVVRLDGGQFRLRTLRLRLGSGFVPGAVRLNGAPVGAAVVANGEDLAITVDELVLGPGDELTVDAAPA